MKNFLAVLSLSLILSSAHANDQELIKSCSFKLQLDEERPMVESRTDIIKKADATLVALTTQTSEGEGTISFEEPSTMEEHKVQAGLSAETEFSDDLNLAEKLIVHAMVMTEDPITKDTFNAGLDLKKVHSAKVYMVGEPKGMGLSAIVEAHDESGKELGSFFGGFIVTPCK